MLSKNIFCLLILGCDAILISAQDFNDPLLVEHQTNLPSNKYDELTRLKKQISSLKPWPYLSSKKAKLQLQYDELVQKMQVSSKNDEFTVMMSEMFQEVCKLLHL